MIMIKYLWSNIREACSLYFTENEFQQTNTILSKILKHEQLSYNKIEHVQQDKDVMLIKYEALAMKWNTWATRQIKAYALCRHAYPQVI